MNHQLILRQLDDERRALTYDGQSIEILPLVTRVQYASGKHHGIIFSELTEETTDTVITEQVSHYRVSGATVEWKVYQRMIELLLSNRSHHSRCLIIKGNPKIVVHGSFL